MFILEVKMNSLEAKKKYEETDVSYNHSQSQITRQTELIDASTSLQLPLKKRGNQTKHTAQLSGQNLLTTDRVTRISSGTIKPRSFSDLCKLSIKNTSKGVTTGSPGKRGPSHSTPKQGKHLKSDDKFAQIIEIQGCENKRTKSENRVTLPNSDTRSQDTVSESTKMIMPSLSPVTITRCDTQNADEMGKLAVAQQQKGRKRKYDLLLSFNDCEKHHDALNMHQISCDSEQSQDAIADEEVPDCHLRNQNSNVCDESGSGVESAVSLVANKLECSKLDTLATELKSKNLDIACLPSAKNTSIKVAYEDEATKEDAHADAAVCTEGVNEVEHPMCTSMLTYVQQCSNNTEGLQVFDAFNPEENTQCEAKRSRKQGQRKQQNFRCTTCKLRFFETKDELEVHVECHIGKPSDPEFYRCKICSYSSAFWNRILSHIIVHDEYKKRLVETRLAQNILGKFLCPECGRSFERKVNMQGHLKKVHFKENHTCDQCGLTLSGVDKKTFTRHQEKCRNVTIACTFCDYTTTVTANMQKHMKIHNGEGFTCTDCSAVFPTRQRFQVRCIDAKVVNSNTLICLNFNMGNN